VGEMKLILIDNQVDLILEAIKNYQTENQQLKYATFESVLEQKISSKATNKPNSKCNENVI
jgi:hypothetical protein